ncbi:transmembrane protein 222-like [Dendronephthya gigantea]|uniref:transmembrane protein 222-like n=1 Tax=Dendronephthya gigantea TaxID=151771 RepID=UPI00106948BB|nr:transmembrane protein 222-like [Dendronephthya gigantea]XP_028393746.1 transmembrane protein 222-like [Dendronephthya gigantea]
MENPQIQAQKGTETGDAFNGMEANDSSTAINPQRSRFPYCIVWTPIPVLTWLFPFIGHMGIAMSSGVIRDFAGPYYVSEDSMAFGRPTKYWKLNPMFVKNSNTSWDFAISEASEVYKHRMHNLFCDNCHSHVAMALNIMNYNGSSSWNMVSLCFWLLVYGKYISVGSFLKTWLPFLILAVVIILIVTLAGSH